MRSEKEERKGKEGGRKREREREEVGREGHRQLTCLFSLNSRVTSKSFQQGLVRRKEHQLNIKKYYLINTCLIKNE